MPTLATGLDPDAELDKPRNCALRPLPESQRAFLIAQAAEAKKSLLDLKIEYTKLYQDFLNRPSKR